ncbi:Splicing factor 3B subunit 3 [Xenoophorus captivus]|uniref:Splicing factor 3B subunit 3 n=1 Tax=Xenoophorus captivus TaxID=1517983 RepID=A0ABV0RMV0_9TELE
MEDIRSHFPLLSESFSSLFFLFLCFKFPSVAVCRFPNTGDDWYILVGVARDMILNPRSVGGGFIYTYRLTAGGEKLEFVHKGRILVGVGKLLRIYDLGKKKLLRKCENKVRTSVRVFPSVILKPQLVYMYVYMNF